MATENFMAAAPMPHELEARELSRDGEDTVVSASSPRILVVDDEESVRLFLREVLVTGGYPLVDVAVDSRDALRQLKTYQYQVVLSDVNMPGMNGLELLEHLRAYYGSIAVLIITGMPDLASAVNAVKMGAYDYLAKPIQPQTLRAAVAAALQRQKEQQAVTQVQMSDLPRGCEYKVIRNLGSGNMGVVLLVEKGGKNYAMKLLRHDARTALPAIQRQRFIREGQVLSQIDHPGVVKIYEYGMPEADEKGNAYFVMEFVPGHALNLLIEQEKLALNEKIAILSQVASALDAVHRQGIIHRDIKPNNVLVTNEMQAKLTDFGVAWIDNSTLTMADEIIGSPAYMAPEYFGRKQPDMDARADIFSLGVLAYEMFTGFRPFRGQSFTELAQSIRSSRPMAPRKLVPDLPADIEAILAGMLAKAPKDRFQTVGEIVVAINRMKASTPMHALKVDLGLRRLLRALTPAKKVWQ